MTHTEPEAASADLDVVVLGGAGHVGVPLPLVLANSGARVGIFDRDGAKLDGIAAGRMPFRETGAEKLLAATLAAGRLEVSTDPAMCARSSVIVVVIGTPVDEFLGPSMAPFEDSVDEIAPHLRPDSLIVLRSTVYPGTTAYVKDRLRERGSEFRVAFCPERIAEGKALEELGSLPRSSAPTMSNGDGAKRCSPDSPRGSSARPRAKPSWPSSSPTRGAT